MTRRPWRSAHASAAGTAHARTGAPCQDAARCTVVAAEGGAEVLVACVADGAGSATRSEAGARLAVERFLQDYAAAAQSAPGLAWADDAQARAWLAALQAEIAALAEAEGATPADYACTLLGAVVGPDAAVFLQVGDGAIVVDAPFGHAWVFWPQHGEFANSTCFVTMPEAAAALAFERRGGVVDEIALFSDGLERLILDMRARTVHSPSLRPVLDWLAGTDPAAEDGRACAVIAAYLDSANVNRRTDDDKSLVLATRAAPP